MLLTHNLFYRRWFGYWQPLFTGIAGLNPQQQTEKFVGRMMEVVPPSHKPLDQLVDKINQTMTRAIVRLKQLENTYFGPTVGYLLTTHTNTNYTHVQGLLEAFKNPQDQRIQFETGRLLDLTQCYLQLDRNKSGQQTHTARRLLHQREIVVGMRRKNVLSWHDPENDYRCTVVSLDGQPPKDNVNSLLLANTPLLVGKIFSPATPPIDVAIQPRTHPKELIEAFARMQRAGASNIALVPDLFGLRFAFKDATDRDNAIRVISERAGNSNDPIREVSSTNPASSKTINIKTKQANLWGKNWEWQFWVLSDLLNIEYGTGPENHELYHLRSYRQLFENFYPPDIYKVYWDGQVLKEVLEKHVITQRMLSNQQMFGWPMP